MATHIHPILRSREDAIETAGLISTLKSVGIVIRRSQELQNLVTKVYPIATYKYNGFNFTPGPTTGTP
jgi:hypothetical protein